MRYGFENKMLELTSNRRKILSDGEKLLKQKRIDIEVEKYYDIDSLVCPEVREKAIEVFDEYEKQLRMELEFYSEYHRTFLDEVLTLANDLSQSEKSRVLARCLPGLEANNSTRMEINSKKSTQNTKIKRLVEIFNLNSVSPSQDFISLESDDDIEEVNNIFQDLDTIARDIALLSRKQIKGEADGKRFVQRFLEFMQKYSS